MGLCRRMFACLYRCSGVSYMTLLFSSLPPPSHLITLSYYAILPPHHLILSPNPATSSRYSTILSYPILLPHHAILSSHDAPPRHKTECAKPVHRNKTLLLDEGDGSQLFVPGDEKTAGGFLLTFKRSYVRRNNGR